MLAARFASQRAVWFSGGGDWPLSLPLGLPGESDAAKAFEAVRTWVEAWQGWRGAGEVCWVERRWNRLGAQRMPERILFQTPLEVAQFLGEGQSWERAIARRNSWCARWPSLAALLPRHVVWLASADDVEFERASALLAWLVANPASDLYLRQLPVPGLDTKWLEGQKARIAEFVGALRGAVLDATDIYAICGLRRAPARLRVRLLDPDLRARFGGLGELQAPVGEWSAVALPAKRVYIVENIQTGLAFDDLDGTALIMGLGYAVDVLGQLPWLAEANVYYWGDLDTHGFAILDRARAHVPHIQSLLMDETTLLAHQSLWGREEKLSGAERLFHLTDEEHALYDALRAHRWGANVRLEQERISWCYAWTRILSLESLLPIESASQAADNGPFNRREVSP